MSRPGWLGKDEVGGVASEARPDLSPPPHWRLDAIYATARPHHVAVSPDGSTIAFVLEYQGTSDIWAMSVGTRVPTRLTTDRGLTAYWDDSSPVFSPDGSRIAYNSGGAVHVLDVSGGVPTRLVEGSVGTWTDDERLVITVDRDNCTRLATVDVSDPWPSPIGPHDGDVGMPRALPDGRVVASYYPKDDFSRNDIVLVEPDGKWSTLVGVPDRRAGGQAVGVKRIAYTLETDDRAAVYLCDFDGSDHQLVAGGDQDFSNLSWLPGDSGLMAIATTRGVANLVRIGLGEEPVVLAVGGTWQTPVITSNGLVAVHEAADSPPTLLLVDDPGATEPLFDWTPASIRAAPHARQERVRFRSEDGLEIEGFLMRPAGTADPVPAVVYAHGGPTAHYGDEWDGHAQYFVDKGYAWLAINFRGSTSYGLEFERANHGDWGVGDVADCVAAAKYLSSLGWVDSDRIAIFGASYGSYLALASLVRVDNPFACGVAKYGDCDILTSWAQGYR